MSLWTDAVGLKPGLEMTLVAHDGKRCVPSCGVFPKNLPLQR